MGFGEAAGGVDGEVQQTVLRRAARRDGDDGPQKVVSGVTQEGGGMHLHDAAPGGWGGVN